MEARSLVGVWRDLIGQDRAVEVLSRAVEAANGGHHRQAMTHAWLFVGPPGSGRSNAARAFAAALQCPDGGCAECQSCRTTMSGAHPDVTVVRTEKLSIGVDEVRDLVRRAAMSPTLGRFQVLIVEDADRITERGADALLKSIEEPAARTIWLLCAPNPDDMSVTIRSRCRLVELTTPPRAAVSALLQSRDGVDSVTADFAARVAQGHIGRARALARSEAARDRRDQVLRLPTRLVDLDSCLRAADELVAAASADARAITDELDETEREALLRGLGMTETSGSGRNVKPRNAQAALRDLDEQHKARAKRLQRDALDRVLTELTSFYRDVLVLQTRADAELINVEQSDAIEAVAQVGSPEATVVKLDAILGARRALSANVAPLLAMESLLISLAAAV